MIQPIDSFLHHLAEILEVEQQSSLIEGLAGEGNLDLIVVPVRILTLPLIVTQVVTGGKRIFYGDFVHLFKPGRSRSTVANLVKRHFNASRARNRLQERGKIPPPASHPWCGGKPAGFPQKY